MSETDTAPKVVEQRFQKASEQKFATYEEARVVFDQETVKRKGQKLRLRRRCDCYAVVLYEPVQKKISENA